MASFRTHISFGLAAGILGVIGLVSAAIADAPSFLIAVFAAATLGSVLPDIDSDSGLPFHISFGALTIVACALVFSSVYEATDGDIRAVIVWTAGTAFFIWVIVGYIFKRVTKHRGMAHSIPAAALSGLGTFFLASRYTFTDAESFILAVAMTAGFLVHLILDEIYAAVNFQGTAFIPNKAFGTALKFASQNRIVNFAIYGAIIFLLAGNTQRLWNLGLGFWNTIQ